MDDRVKGLMFSSLRGDWETPQKLFDKLHSEFSFALDAAAKPSNAKCSRYLSHDRDAFKLDWHREADGGSVFLNPPYGRGIDAWLGLADQWSEYCRQVVCLVPARTDTRWFHEIVADRHEVRFLKGRVNFEIDGIAQDPAPFPSMIVVMRKEPRPLWRGWNWKESEKT